MIIDKEDLLELVGKVFLIVILPIILLVGSMHSYKNIRKETDNLSLLYEYFECNSCNNKVETDFCTKCGSDDILIIYEDYCKYCNKLSFDDTDEFCGSCGEKLFYSVNVKDTEMSVNKIKACTTGIIIVEGVFLWTSLYLCLLSLTGVVLIIKFIYKSIPNVCLKEGE